jgi:hypothetical protein
VRALAALLLLLAAAAPGPTLGRLADVVAAEIAHVAGARAVELAPPEDRTGTGILGSDLHSMVRTRLEGRVAVTTSGPRLVVSSVVAQVGSRLVWSGRVVEEPGGAVVDLLSASTEWDPALLPLVPVPASTLGEAVDVLSRATTPPTDERVVALAFAGDERLLVLSDSALALYRRDGLALRLVARRELPGPLAPVRFPGGLLLAVEGESACWALSSRAPRAVLFALDGGGLSVTEQADAMPWPGTATGARFRPGTNLIEVSVPGIDTPVLAMDVESGWVVGPEGTLVRAGGARAPAIAAGPAIARLWPGLMAAASADPPGENDRILFLRDPPDLTGAGSLRVEGAVRALAARRHGSVTVLAAATEDATGAFRLVLLDLAERRP